MEKRILSKEEVYGRDMTLIDNKYIYYSDNTCIGIFDKVDYICGRIEYYNIENPYSIDIPKYKWLKKLTMIEYANGNKYWYVNGEFHREDGPAIIINGHKKWYLNGELHREDGPAVEFANGDKECCLNGKRYTKFRYYFKLWKRKRNKKRNENK